MLKRMPSRGVPQRRVARGRGRAFSRDGTKRPRRLPPIAGLPRIRWREGRSAWRQPARNGGGTARQHSRDASAAHINTARHAICALWRKGTRRARCAKSITATRHGCLFSRYCAAVAACRHVAAMSLCLLRVAAMPCQPPRERQVMSAMIDVARYALLRLLLLRYAMPTILHTFVAIRPPERRAAELERHCLAMMTYYRGEESIGGECRWCVTAFK